ncbi:UDP-N-acetylglucosamine 4,6-dehydratase [soil metagenome]
MTLADFDLDGFIARHVIGRDESLFAEDLRTHDAELRAGIRGKSVLVIGGAGTIGSSYIKALLRYEPARLFVVDLNENGLTELTRDLRSTEGQFVPDDYKTYPINFGDVIFERMFRQEGPFDIVAHFAAHKHVRSEKDRYSIEAMLENNVVNTVKLLDLLVELPPQHFFCVSTDKAANPANLMGASKKLMEEAVMAYSTIVPATTARFANVAFSNGSLPAGFLERIAKRQPLSAPSDVRRYFVSPIESGELCLLACITGHPADIFFPRLGEPKMLTFSTIADALLRELGYEPDPCATEEEARAKAAAIPANPTTWPVAYFESDTSGEKSFEEFYTSGETVDLERFAALGVVKGSAVHDVAGIRSVIGELHTLFSQPELPKSAIVDALVRLVPTLHHVETGKSLDQKM